MDGSSSTYRVNRIVCRGQFCIIVYQKPTMNSEDFDGDLQFRIIDGSSPVPTNHRATIYVPIILISCIIFSSLALSMNWFFMEIEYDFDEPGLDDVKVTLEDDLSERETKFVIDGERSRDVEDNDELENQGYEDTVSQKVTLKVLTIIVLVFTGICAILSIVSFTNFLPLSNISSVLLWIILLLVVVEVVFFAVFYNPFAGDVENDDSDTDIECEDEDLEGGGTLNIYGEGSTECTIMGEEATVKIQFNASSGFWFMAFQVVLILIAAIFSTAHSRSLSKNQSTTKIHMF